MDLSLYTRVLWRFRWLVLGGFVLACVLAFFSYARVGLSGISYRQADTWQSTTRLLITQSGFQIGKLSSANSTTSPDGSSTPVASPQYLGSLGPSYAELGNGDAVLAMFKRGSTAQEKMTVTPVYDSHGYAQPVLDVNGLGPSAADAARASRRGAAVFIAYVQQQQNVNGVASNNRVQLEVLNQATPAMAQILAGRKKTTPIVIFAAVMIAAIGLAFILENLRPRVRAVPAEAGEEPRFRKQASA